MSKKEKKLNTLFSYLRDSGFNQSLENIAFGIGVTKKTLFNRHKSRTYLEVEVVDYWRQCVIDRYGNRTLFTNNAVERLIFFIYELKKCKESETHFFNREKERIGFEPDVNEKDFHSVIQQILEEGKSEELFSPQVNAYFWGHLLLFNIFFLILNDAKNISVDFVVGMLSPLLTESGNEILSSLDLERVLC